jgi:hypothetical protein
MDVRRRVASLSALGGGIAALAVDVLYVNLIISQRAPIPGNRVPLVAAWIAACAVLAIIGAFTAAPSRRAWLLGWSTAALLALSAPAIFSIGIPLLLCAIAIGTGALRAAEQLEIRRWVAYLAPLLMIGVAGAALLVGFLATAP